MRKITYLPILLIVFFFASCDKDLITETQTETNLKVEGDWEGVTNNCGKQIISVSFINHSAKETFVDLLLEFPSWDISADEQVAINSLINPSFKEDFIALEHIDELQTYGRVYAVAAQTQTTGELSFVIEIQEYSTGAEGNIPVVTECTATLTRK